MSIRTLIFVMGLTAVASTAMSDEATYYSGHKSGIREMKVSPDAKLLATVASDGQIILRKADDLNSTQVLKYTDRAFDTFCFTKDTRYLLATGNLENLQMLTDGFMKFDLRDSSRKFSNFQVLGSIRNFNLTDDETHVTYLSGSKLCHLNLETLRFSATTPLPDPRSHNGVAVSPDSQYYAFHVPTASRGMVNGQAVTRWVEPSRLVVMRPSGEEVVSQKLPAEPAFRNSLLHFVDPQRLLVCQGTGKIFVWKLDAKQQNLGQQGPPITLPEDRYSALCNGLSDEVCWLGSKSSLIAVELQTGKIVQKVELKIAEKPLGFVVQRPITGLTVMRPQKQVVAGLWDGRIAVIAAKF